MDIVSFSANVMRVLGLIVLVLSIAMYIKRTGDYSMLTRFWASKAKLSKAELMLNRVGLAVLIFGLIFPMFIRGAA